MASSFRRLEETRDRLYPLLLPPRRVESLGEGQMVARLLAEDLAVVYVEDLGPNEIRYITWTELEAWGIGPGGLHQIALWNLEARTRPLRPTVLSPPDRNDPMIIWNVEDGYDAARLLLHRWLAWAASRVDGRLLVAVPDRHWLAATGDRNPAKREAFHRLARERYQRSVFPVSPRVYRWTGDRLDVDRL